MQDGARNSLDSHFQALYLCSVQYKGMCFGMCIMSFSLWINKNMLHKYFISKLKQAYVCMYLFVTEVDIYLLDKFLTIQKIHYPGSTQSS